MLCLLMTSASVTHFTAGLGMRATVLGDPSSLEWLRYRRNGHMDLQ